MIGIQFDNSAMKKWGVVSFFCRDLTGQADQWCFSDPEIKGGNEKSIKIHHLVQWFSQTKPVVRGLLAISVAREIATICPLMILDEK